MSIVALTVGFYTIQWNRAQYLGKTPEQIVAMGRTKWHELYGKKRGFSTVDMVECEGLYGDALKNLNDRALRKLPEMRRKWLTGMRKVATDYAYSAHSVGYFMTGGGTMWNLIDSSIYPDVEEVISACIKGGRVPAIKFASFESMYKKIEDKVAGGDYLDPKSANYKVEYVAKYRKDLAGLKGREKPLEAVLGKGTSEDSTRFRIYVMRKLDAATGIEE
jgi:hypothetical protein